MSTDELARLQLEIERLRAAGNALVEAVNLMTVTSFADALPVVKALDAWEEVARG